MKSKLNTNLKLIHPLRKSGKEPLTFSDKKTKYNLQDFWRWSVSDILSNATRGILAEFIVGTVIGLDPKDVRIEWDTYDLTSKDGIKIEVKSSAYIQSWKQKDYSKISFSIKPTHFLDPQTLLYQNEAKRHADVYVFCLLKHKDQDTIDPLKLEQWEFYVVPTPILSTYGGSQNRIILSKLKKIAEPINYNELYETVQKASKNEK
jgi:hypothetical protein